MLCEKTRKFLPYWKKRFFQRILMQEYIKKDLSWKNILIERTCEISLTLHLDGDEPWSICIETPEKEQRSVSLNPGDAMLYLGRIASHWRDEYKGNYYSQVFLHYVKSRGECSYAYFDNRDGKIGTPDKEEKPQTPEIVEKVIEELPTKTDVTTSTKSTRKLQDFIKVYDGIIDKDLCDRILSEYEKCNNWQQTMVGEGVIDTNSRNCSVVQLSNPEIIDENFEVRKFIDVELHQQLLEVVQKYAEDFPEFAPSIDTGYDLLRYEEGQFYRQHTDSFLQQQRSISCSVCINEDYLGGEFAFFDREVMIRGGKGSVIVFPSNFMFPHEIMPVLEGTRYSIITWYV